MIEGRCPIDSRHWCSVDVRPVISRAREAPPSAPPAGVELTAGFLQRGARWLMDERRSGSLELYWNFKDIRVRSFILTGAPMLSKTYVNTAITPTGISRTWAHSWAQTASPAS
jgi:hypothetical protein